jgi:membrane protein DedA with SNARE-associated domain
MNISPGGESLAYLAVFIATVLEGEVVFVGASVLVSLGELDPLGVFVAAALGGSTGDQFFFYALRSGLPSWLARYSFFARLQRNLEVFVGQHSTAMILGCRFLPGLRIAIPAACAFAGVRPVKFSALSLIGSAGWSAAILLLVSYLGPQALARLGITAWWAPRLSAVAVIALVAWSRRRSRAMLKEPPA